TFNQSAVPNFYQIAGQTAIVPQHIWSTYSDPVAQKVDKPIGTGPFTMSACTGQNIQFTRNANYWQKGLPHLQTVNYPAFLDNDPANAFLAAGQAQWGGQYIPNIDTYYVAKDPQHNHYWFPPIDNINIWFNTTIAPLDNKLVRQAFAYAIDRDAVSKKGESGYEPPGSQAYFDKLFNGDFQLAYGSLNTSPGPTPYYELRNTLHSGTTAPLGQSAAGDYGRYKNSAIDTLLDQFGGTADTTKQHDIIK